MRAAEGIQECAMLIATQLYSAAQVLFAPNRELCIQLEEATGRRCFLMRRGVDCKLFSPKKRRRPGGDGKWVLGFVGRLSVEKNVRLLARIQRELELSGRKDFRFVIVGHGSEEVWLRRNLPGAKFMGVLQGEALADAYADMDLLVFPSHTDTFGNVVLEALASVVPAVVTRDGGPASFVRDWETGRIVEEVEFAAAISALLDAAPLHGRMRLAARNYALTRTWNSVFEDVYKGYGYMPPMMQTG
jgi:phosphatidylinositol alpha 1,6-mannosyltransferase